jgi:ankyrin repeat protein
MLSIYAGQTQIRDFLHSGLEPDLPESAALGDLDRLRRLLGEESAAAREHANSRSADGWPLLHLAAAFGGQAAANLLIEAGAEVDQVARTPLRNRALHAALALSRDAATVGMLLEAGADPEAPEAAGYRPLHLAAVSGRTDLIRVLLEAGADPEARCDRGRSAAEYAGERGHAEAASMLEAAVQEAAAVRAAGVRAAEVRAVKG